MKIKKLLVEWKIWLLFISLVLSIVAISPSFSPGGVIITTIEQGSPLRDYISTGDRISSINELEILSQNEIDLFEGYTQTLRIFINENLVLIDTDGKPLGIGVRKSGSKINLGMELVGGTRALLKPIDIQGEEIVSETITVLQNRMNVYGLQEMNFQSVKDIDGNYYVQVEVAGLGRKDIEELLSRQGSFSATIPRFVEFKNGTGEFWNQTFTYNNGLFFRGKEFFVNDTLKINDISFEVLNYTNITLVLEALVYTGDDIKFVYSDPQNSAVTPSGTGSWQFSFQILVSDDGAEKFSRITEDIPRDIGGEYLTQSIFLFIDDIAVSNLRIGASLAGQAFTSPSISGGESSRDGAIQEMKRLQSVLKGGALPTALETVKVDTISPSLGKEFVSSVMTAGLLALSFVALIIYFYYRKIKLIPLIMLTSISEMLIVLGIAAFAGWTIDLAAIAGILAAVGTGVDDQIVITDEVFKSKAEKWVTVSDRVKRAFTIILGAAAATIVAMLPLMFIGIGVMRGFAITTVTGILVGILITRPAYGRLIEIIADKN